MLIHLRNLYGKILKLLGFNKDSQICFRTRVSWGMKITKKKRYGGVGDGKFVECRSCLSLAKYENKDWR